MSVRGSLQLPHESGFFLNHGQNNRYKIVEVKSRACTLRAPLSSRASRHDGWSLHVSDRMNKPLYYIPRRYNVFVCGSFSIPSSATKIPLLRSTTLALTRSYNALCESPLVIQLVPAVGIIAFAVWGLGPLMRHGRSLFLQRNDSNWKKSRTYYVFTSYLQPLLLWTGATLICRALDPIAMPSEASQAVKQRLLNFIRSLSTVLASAYCLSSLIQQAQKTFLERNDTGDKRNMSFHFAGRAVYTAVWVAAVSLFMELLGFSTQKWVTAGGLGTVLLTLAGREILTNFLSSIMIHATRPFVVNEWIQTKIEGYEVSGTVEHVGWWSPTIIRGEDREAVHIPNHKFTVNVVRNLTQKIHWRIKTHLAISHLDVNKINNIVADMRKVLAKNPQVEHKRLHRRVFLDNINPENQALLILISCFVKTSHFEEYLCVKEAILLDLLRVVRHHRARLATPIRTVQKVYSDANVENVPISETIYTRGGPSIDRPLLLIEPSPRINGDDRSKSRTQPRPNEEQTTKPTAASEPKVTPVTEGATKNNSDKQKKANKSGDTLSKSSMVEPSTGSNTSSKPQLEGLETAGLGSKAGEASGIPPKVNAKLENERSARPNLEDNIVLGVALEGSKRTLPIEEGSGPGPTSPEAKELASSRSGSGSSSPSKDKKESQMPAPPGSSAVDQRDQER